MNAFGQASLAKLENTPYGTMRPEFNVSQFKFLNLLSWFTPSQILINVDARADKTFDLAFGSLSPFDA